MRFVSAALTLDASVVLERLSSPHTAGKFAVVGLSWRKHAITWSCTTLQRVPDWDVATAEEMILRKSQAQRVCPTRYSSVRCADVNELICCALQRLATFPC